MKRAFLSLLALTMFLGNTFVPLVYAASDPVGYWKLDETSGTTAVDSGTGGNNGGYQGTPTQDTGNKASLNFSNTASLSFNGSTDYLTANGIASSLQGESSWTVAFWASADSYQLVDAALSLSASGDTNTSFVFYPYDNSGGNGVRIWFNGANLIDVTDGDDLADGTFHHFVFVSRSATDHEVFIDGESFATSNTSQSLSGSLNEFYIGNWAGAAQLYDGNLDDIRIYDTALSNSEIVSLAAGNDVNSSSGGAEVSFFSWWSLSLMLITGIYIWNRQASKWGFTAF